MKLIISEYGEYGQKISVENSNGELGAVIYIDNKGNIQGDSWLR